jgi:hypothetical protein
MGNEIILGGPGDDPNRTRVCWFSRTYDLAVDAFEKVEPVFQAILARVWAGGDEDLQVLGLLTPLERAVYATRMLEGAIDNGGWYSVFYNNVDHMIEPAIDGYEVLGLPDYAEHLRNVRALGFREDSPEALGTAVDHEYFALSGSEEARAVALWPS